MVYLLKKLELQEEIIKFDLSIIGTVEEMRKRLIEFIKERGITLSLAFGKMPFTFQKSSECILLLRQNQHNIGDSSPAEENARDELSLLKVLK